MKSGSSVKRAPATAGCAPTKEKDSWSGLVAAETAAAVVTATEPISAIKSDVGITVVGSVVAVRIAVRIGIGAGIAACHARRAAAFKSAAIHIFLSKGPEGLLALCSVNLHGIDEAECQLRFRRDDGGMPAREEHRANSCDESGARADGSTGAPIRRGTNRRANAGGADDGAVGQFDSQLGGALDAAGFLDIFHFTDDGLAAASDDPAIDDERLVQNGGELVANPIVIGGEEVVGANDEDGACRNSQSAGHGLGGLRSLSGLIRLRRRLRVVSHGPGVAVARVGRLVGVLRGVGRP